MDRLLARAPAGGTALRVEARVEQLGLRRYHLVLETSEEGNRFRRELDAPTCEALTKPAALIIALTIDPEATARVLAETAPETPTGSAQPEAPVEAHADAAPQPAPAPEPAPVQPRSVAPAADSGLSPRKSEASAGTGWSPYVRPAVVFDASVLPQPSTGPGLAIGIARVAWRFELGAFYLPTRFAESEQNPLKGGDISLAAATLASCLAPLREPLELGPCLGVEAGVLHGTGVGVSTPADDDVAWLAARGGGRLAFAFGRNFAASLRADALARIGRGEFVIENVGLVHQPGSVGLRLEAGIELGLR